MREGGREGRGVHAWFCTKKKSRPQKIAKRETFFSPRCCSKSFILIGSSLLFFHSLFPSFLLLFMNTCIMYGWSGLGVCFCLVILTLVFLSPSLFLLRSAFLLLLLPLLLLLSASFRSLLFLACLSGCGCCLGSTRGQWLGFFSCLWLCTTYTTLSSSSTSKPVSRRIILGGWCALLSFLFPLSFPAPLSLLLSSSLSYYTHRHSLCLFSF